MHSRSSCTASPFNGWPTASGFDQPGVIEFFRSLLMDPDEKRVNFQHGDRRNPDDAADCAEKDEYQQ
jgi:hypothetical protein